MNNEEPSTTEGLPDVDVWIEKQSFSSTADIKVPESLADQVIGQDKAVEVIVNLARVFEERAQRETGAGATT